MTTGEVYSRYETLCSVYSEDSVSQRSISDVITDFERLGILDAEYHYGGKQGKTREIGLAEPFAEESEPVIHG